MFFRGNIVRGNIFVQYILCQEGGQVIQGELVMKLEWCLEYSLSSSKRGKILFASFDDVTN